MVPTVPKNSTLDCADSHSRVWPLNSFMLQQHSIALYFYLALCNQTSTATYNIELKTHLKTTAEPHEHDMIW
ncbi:hypothetical protein EGR_07972 [Echinococcus granulosus]|uniref:Uncharacterized protein n=1 Tax=Echinococcus granulosus TaxID=6210 RepID=W6U7K6_ECHGR|nr:hypothetical protein EGR_07972 [Echinococcus granulosus]EUB57155.1 hypothetical protein EGR_07972 [Echinococcus granulosus]